MTDEERDALLLELKDSVERLEKGQAKLEKGQQVIVARLSGVEVYTKGIAQKLVHPSELLEIERKARTASAIETADI